MSNVTHLLNLASVRCHAEAPSRKRALQLAAELIAANSSLSADALFDGLMERERLGSTGLGDGVAIPHCRTVCDDMRVALLTLRNPINHESGDSIDVDILFVLVVPNDENDAHLQALATLSEIFANPDNRRRLRACTDDETLLTCIQDIAESATDNPPTA